MVNPEAFRLRGFVLKALLGRSCTVNDYFFILLTICLFKKIIGEKKALL